MTEESPLLVCLTGGVASGKTVVSDFFESNGVDVIDADLVSREVVEVGSEGLNELVSSFGEEYLNSDGELNRALLREQVFSDKKSLKLLNDIVHPRIHKSILQQIKSSSSKIIVVVIPLFEGQKEYTFFDRVCVVDIDIELQIKRLQKRDDISIELTRRMIGSQIKRSQRLKLADDVLVNNGSVVDLELKAAQLMNCFKLINECDIQSCH